jgi:hypothetical protein
MFSKITYIAAVTIVLTCCNSVCKNNSGVYNYSPDETLCNDDTIIVKEEINE